MAEIEFELIFALPEGEHEAFDLMDAVFEAGFEFAKVRADELASAAIRRIR